MPTSRTKKIVDLLSYLQSQPKGVVYKNTEDKLTLLKKLNAKYVNCTQCPLAFEGRTQVVFGSGNPNSNLMFVGEGPGKDEDIKGIPFIGRAGQLLSKIIEAMGLKREDIYISNVVKCRPPQNRTPLPIETNTCKKLLLFKEISIIQPKIICTLGNIATKALLGEHTQLSHCRGRFQETENLLIMPTYHPAYLLRNPNEKKTVWNDMKQIMKALKTL